MPSPAGDGVFLHAEGTGDVVANSEGGISGCDHAACAQGTHDLTDLDRGDIRPSLVHPAAHRRVERKVEQLDQDLAVARIRDGLLGEGPVAPSGHAGGTGRQAKLMVDQVMLRSRARGARRVGSSAHFFHSPWNSILRSTAVYSEQPASFRLVGPCCVGTCRGTFVRPERGEWSDDQYRIRGEDVASAGLGGRGCCETALKAVALARWPIARSNSRASSGS